MSDRIGPVLGAFSQPDKIRYRLRRLLVEELAGDTPHAGVEYCGWTGRLRADMCLCIGRIR